MSNRKQWRELTMEEQVRLREAYGHYLDRLPATCSLDDKISRFQHWLAERGIDFDRDDLSGRNR
jgi:hypothetical protein